jgi:hypothetical protein
VQNDELSALHFTLVLLFFLLFSNGRFLQSAHHILFKCFLLKHESVLVPDEVWGLQVEAIALHATIEETQDVAVVRVSSEGKRSAILHEFFELYGLVETELFN